MIMRTLRTQVKWIMITVVVVFVLSILFMYGGRGRGGRQGKEDYPVAEINGMTLMRSQLYRSMVNLAEQSGKKDISPRDVVLYRVQVVNNVAIGEELKKEIKNRKIKISDEDVDKAYKEMEDRFPTRESFMESMERSGTTEKKLKKQIKEDLSRQALLQQAGAGEVATKEDLEKTYNSLKDVLFARPETIYVRAAHFRNHKNSAQEALEQLQDGVAWGAMVATYGDDMDDHTSGDATIPFTQNQVPPMLWTVLSEVEDGASAGPVEVTSQDFYVLQRIRTEKAHTLSLEEVSDDLEEMVLVQKQQRAQQEFLNTLLSRAKIKILDSSLFEIPSEDVPPEASKEVSPNSPGAETEEGGKATSD